MKVFISQPMNGKTEEEIKRERKKIEDSLCLVDAEVLNTIFELEIDNPIIYLAKSIEQLAIADIVVFANGWKKARGCRIEHDIAKSYGKKILFLGEEKENEK